MNNSEEHLTAPFLHFETIAYTNFEVKLAFLAWRSDWLFSKIFLLSFAFVRHHSFTSVKEKLRPNRCTWIAYLVL